jgi:hypothetical protein
LRHQVSHPRKRKGKNIVPNIQIFKSPDLLDVFQTGSGVHPTSYPMGTGALSPGVKRLGREADQSPPASAEVKKMWI